MSATYLGTFAPVPVVTVDGVDVASGAASAAEDGLMVVDGVSVTWGRDGVLDQPRPATGRLVLFDPTRTWATSSDRRSRPVTIRYEGVSDVDGSTVSAVYFRGRIGSPVQVARRDVVHPITGQTIRGAVVTVPLQSIVVDLANIVPRSSWPAETMGARVDRCVTEARKYGRLSGGANLRDFWKPPNVAPVAAADQVSLLDHLTALFSSSGADSYTYRPAEDSLAYVPRRNYETVPNAARLTRATTGPRANAGAYVRARNQFFGAGDTESATGLYLDAGTLEYDPADGVTTPARITRVALTSKDEGVAYADRTAEKTVVSEPWDPLGGYVALDETALGVRTAQVDSQVAWNDWADLALSDTELLVRREGSRWLLDDLRLTTRRLGGFESVAHAQLLLAGWERNDVVFLQRSQLPQLGLRPVYGVMGGTIAYASGGWDVTFTPAPITTTVRQHALTWEDLQTADPGLQLQWWDTPNAAGLDPTVTYEDLRFVGMGLDGTDLPATDKDEYQA